jgi:hypothetical protein
MALFSATRRLVLDRREHGGMLAVQRDKEKRRRGASH